MQVASTLASSLASWWGLAGVATVGAVGYSLSYKLLTRNSDIADLKGSVVVVTGSNNGIGKEIAGSMAQMGAHVIMVCRNKERAEAAMVDIRKDYGEDCKLEFMACDMNSLDSVRSFAHAYKARGLPLHILVNNAGIALVPYAETADGHESCWGVNYLAPFLLTMELLEVMKKSGPARIVNVGSMTTAIGKPFPATKSDYQKFQSYGNSKFALTLFTYELARRLKDTNISCYIADPGTAATDIHRSLPGFIYPLGKLFVRMTFRSAKQGAQAIIHAAVSPSLENKSGASVNNCRVQTPTPRDEVDIARKLFDETVEKLSLSGVFFRNGDGSSSSRT